MKYFFSLVLFVTLVGVKAQSLANYSSARNTAVTYASINVGGSSFASWRNTTSNTQDDNRSDFTNIGFDFWYDGTRYTQFCVSTNGFLDFSTSTDDGGPAADDFGYQNTAFTAANAANATRPAIAPFYDDLTAQGGTAALGNSIKYYLSGSAPNRTLTVEWINMAVYNNTSPSLNFQVKLVETTGQVIIHYGTMTAGTNNFSYSMGMNGPTVSNNPTAAQLKELQTVNTNNFSNTAQNNLSAMPAANSQYIFTPVAPTSPSGNLTFSGVNQTAMTLNWTNWASNEVGYVLYNSTDNVNFDFVTQTAANATSYAATGLLPSTTYYWRLYAVTEGALSAAVTGTQTTTAAGNKTSNATGAWSTASIWTPTGVPTAADNVTIANGHVVSISTNAVCNNLTIGQGAATTLQFSGGTARTLSVNNNITVANSAVFTTLANSNVTHSVTVDGNMTNNGTVNFAVDAASLVNLLFDKDGNVSFSGTGPTTSLNRLGVALGSAVTNTLEISTSNLTAASNFLDLTAGTLKVSTTNAVNITPFANAVTITANTGLHLNSANLTMNTGAGVTLYGSITIVNGTLNVGNASNEDLVASGGSIDISNGALNIAGNLDGSGVNNVCDFNISGGVVTVPTFGSTDTGVAPFHISSAGSQCNMTGGTIVIQREGGSGTQHLGFINTSTSGAIVTGGTLQIGNSSTPASQTININTDSQIQNLAVNSANATASISTNILTVEDRVNIISGTLNGGALGLNVGGNWTNSGSFTPGTSTINFNGASAQSILKTNGETFYALQFSGSGVKTFSSAVTTNNNFSITSGASVDVSTSNYSLTVKGSFMNSGTFTARSGLVMLNGTIAQSIGGSSTTDFYNLSLSNTAGASLAHAENLKGTLTLSNGVFNATGQVFTMISDASGTARIAQITGTGDYSGNVTVQRFAPGGTTGWALLGSPISSALTFNDWDDNIYISCSSCPDGSAAGFVSVYSYNETVSGAYDAPASYVAMSSINNPITSGKGYWVYLGNGQSTTTDITLDLTGTPRKGNYSIPLNYTNFGSSANDGWNLITNPYPSAISWAALRGATSNIDNAIYVYNADLNAGTGGFASYVNGISSPAVASGGIGDNIPMGQGFYVHSTGATALSAQESNKVAANPTFLKSSVAAQQPLMRLKLLGGNAYEDETVLYLDPAAHAYFDEGYDSYKMRGQDPTAAQIALENGADVFQINGIAPVVGTFTAPLKTLTGISGQYTITADNVGSFPGACITLYDKFNSVTTDLKSSDYVFSLEDTTTVSRFVLTITSNSLSIVSQVSQPSCSSPEQGEIVAKGNNSGPWNYYWSQSGVSVKTSLNKTTADTLYNLSSGNFDLAIETIGGCDYQEDTYSIDQQLPVTASFSGVDTVYLSLGQPLQLTNTSTNAATSFWDFGTGLDYSSLYSPNFTYSNAGNYNITLLVSSSSGCQDTATKTVHVIMDVTGISTLSKSVKGLVLKTLENNEYVLELSSDQLITVSSQLMDASGKEVANYGTQNGADLSWKIGLDGFAKGLYFLNISSEKGRQVVKLPVK